MQVLTRARARTKVSLRNVTIVRDETGDGVRVTSPTGSAQIFMENWKKVGELKLDTGRRRSTFGARWGETNLRAVGAVRDRGQMNKTALRDCVSPPYVETFNSKLIKRFCTWTSSRYVFSNCEIPMFYRYEHYMSISHMAIFVYMAT